MRPYCLPRPVQVHHYDYEHVHVAEQRDRAFLHCLVSRLPNLTNLSAWRIDFLYTNCKQNLLWDSGCEFKRPDNSNGQGSQADTASARTTQKLQNL